MVNKAALSVLGVIVLVSMGVGILIGMQLGGPVGDQGNSSGNGGPTPIPDDNTPTPVPTANPGSSAPNGPVQTRTPESTVPADEFDAEAIEKEMERLINENRQSRGYEPLDTSGLLAQRVEWMARNHSIAMAEDGRAIHKIDDQTSADRYREANLYDTCKFQPNDNGATISSDGTNFENIAKVYAGKPYSLINGVPKIQYSKDSENTYYLKNNTAVANRVVSTWFDNRFLDDKLLYKNANVVGVGVEVTDEGGVYATANVC